MEQYQENAQETIDFFINQLPVSGQIELGSFWRKVVHKFAFTCWVGKALAEKYLEQFGNNFNIIDPEQAFVEPLGLLKTILSRKSREKKALAEIIKVMSKVWQMEQATNSGLLNNLRTILPDLFPQKDPQELDSLAVLIIIGFHLASQTNLTSATTWTTINLLNYPQYGPEISEEFIYETIRLTQQSLTLRVICQDIEFNYQPNKTLKLSKGCYLATLLNVLNTSQIDTTYPPDQFHPERYRRNKLINCPVGFEQVVSTFGHLRHACPGEKLSLQTIQIFTKTLITRLKFEEKTVMAEIPKTQIGAMARTQNPVYLSYIKN